MKKTNQLESDLNKINLNLRKKGTAIILKKAVPITATANGLIAQSSTVDYDGLVKSGLFIAYDAKECQSKTSFPLSNIKQHQTNYLEAVFNLGGFAFFVIHMKAINKYYLVPVTAVLKVLQTDKKSIPVSDFKAEWECSNLTEYLESILKNESIYRNTYN